MEVKVTFALVFRPNPSACVFPMLLSSSFKHSLEHVCIFSHLFSGARDMVGHDVSIPAAMSKMKGGPKRLEPGLRMYHQQVGQERWGWMQEGTYIDICLPPLWATRPRRTL